MRKRVRKGEIDREREREGTGRQNMEQRKSAKNRGRPCYPVTQDHGTA